MTSIFRLFVIGALLLGGIGCSTIKKVCNVVPVPVLCSGSDCPFDCNGDKKVDIADLTILTAIKLGNQPLSACPTADVNGNGKLDAEEQAAAQAAAEAGTVCK